MFRRRGEGRKPYVARRMGRSPGNFRSRLRRSRKFLARFAHEEIAAPPRKHPSKKSRHLRRLSRNSLDSCALKPPYWISRLCSSCCSNPIKNKTNGLLIMILKFISKERKRSLLYISDRHTLDNKTFMQIKVR